MSTGTREAGPLAGQVGALFGALAVAAVAWVAVLTFSSLDPPEAVRIAGSAFLPVGIASAIVAAVAGRHGESRPWAFLGLAEAAAAVVALVVMQLVVDY